MASAIQGSFRAVEFCLQLTRGAAPFLIPTAGMTKTTSPLHNEFVIRHAEKLAKPPAQTLVLMYGFYGATNKALSKYSNIYHNYGFDVLPIRSHLKHFAWPKCSNVLADQTLAYLHDNCLGYENYLVHAFSMGAYNFTVCTAKMYEDPEMYSKVQNKICGVIYDSLAIGSLDGMINGIASGISRNKLVQWSIPMTMSMYYYLTHRHTVAIYDHFLDIARHKQLNVPKLLFYCKNDLLSKYDVINEWTDEWVQKQTFPVEKKCWDKSKHAAHLLVHEAEYLQTLDKFVKSVPVLTNNLKIYSKM